MSLASSNILTFRCWMKEGWIRWADGCMTGWLDGWAETGSEDRAGRI